MSRWTGPLVLAVSCAGCASPATLIREGRYGEACHALRREDPLGPRVQELSRAVEGELEGSIALHVLDAREVEAVAGHAPAHYGDAGVLGSVWAVAAAITLSRLVGTSVDIRASSHVGTGWVLGERAATRVFGIEPRRWQSDTPWLDLALETIGGSRPPVVDREAGALRDAAVRLEDLDDAARGIEEPGVVRPVFVIASRDAVQLEEGALELVISASFVEGDGPTTCDVDVRIPVPLRTAGRDVREQLDGVVIPLPRRPAR